MERGRRLDRAFSDAATDLDSRDRAFAHELAYGVTRLRGRIDHLLAPYVTRGLDSVEPPLLELLRAGAYQLFWMDGVPEYAAVSTTVDHARSIGGRKAAGFSNAVLRRVQAAGAGPERFPDAGADPAARLPTHGSHPRWLVERWLARWSPEEVARLVRRNNRVPGVCVVPVGATPEAAASRLREAGIEAEPVGEGTACVRLARAADVVRALDIASPAIVQDPAANLVARYADVPSGTMVADFCAAPGGKILALPAARLQILAADRSESRILVLRENARRVGRPVALTVADALHPPVRDANAVLLDVPCSGTGTLARNPDARWRLEEDSIGAMASLQARMLAAAADVVRPGGLLLYSTCTLESEENHERVEAFLADRPDFVLEATEAVPSRFRDRAGFLEVTPHEHDFDGAFAARLRRDA